MIRPGGGPRADAYAALIRGILTIERTIAPLWLRRFDATAVRDRTVRARVTANGLRELDVLLAHWRSRGDDAGVQDRVMAAAEAAWNARERSPAWRTMAFRPADIAALAVLYWIAAHEADAMHDCNLLTGHPC